MSSILFSPSFPALSNPFAPPPPRPIGRKARGESLVQLGQSRFEVYSFETRRAGEPRTAAPRTVGQVGLLVDAGRGRLGPIGEPEAVELCRRGVEPPSSPEAAKEKVIFASRAGEVRVYQADRASGSAALCACGNAAAAAAAVLARALGSNNLRLGLALPEARVEMRARVTGTGAGGERVEQSWAGVRPQVTTARLLGREAVVCTGAFNDYLILPLPDRAAVEVLALDEVLALWQEARRLSGFDDPLRARLAAVGLSGPLPYAKFFTCGRTHPGAPLTGLATLAVAAADDDRLAPVRQRGRVEHRRGVDALPVVRETPHGTEVAFPGVDLRLRGE